MCPLPHSCSAFPLQLPSKPTPRPDPLYLFTFRLWRACRVKTDIRTILLAEDNSNDVELTLEAFRQNHLLNDIVVVRDGAEALDYLYKRNAYADRPNGSPALILLDLKMPKVDGLEVLRTIKSDGVLKTIPVVVL